MLAGIARYPVLYYLFRTLTDLDLPDTSYEYPPKQTIYRRPAVYTSSVNASNTYISHPPP
jgi:hypothetical protein